VHATKVVAVEVEQITGDEHQPLLMRDVRVPERLEIGMPCLSEDDHLAVQDRALGPKLQRFGADLAILR
jgi:hypothetical protein